jgi:arylsulfatase A-like enzyme
VDLSRFHRLRGDDQDDHWRRCFAQYLRNVSSFKSEEDYFVARVVKQALRWLEDVTKKQKDNLFLWVDCFDPHEAWDPPSPYREMYDPGYTGQELIDPVPGPVEGYMSPEELKHTLALYAGEVTLVDKWVGALLDRIRDLGLYDNSLIMFTSDHGEPFGEHGIVRKAALWGYEELCHIPWIIRHPDAGHGKRFSGFVQPPDLMPTVLDAAGVRTGLEFTGCSLMPVLTGQRETVRDFAVSAWHDTQWTIRTADWTYLMNLDAGKQPELYDRKSDHAEQHNVWENTREVGDELELKLRRFAGEVDGTLIA